MTTPSKSKLPASLDPDRLAALLRGRAVRLRQKQVLLARFHGTEQELDVTSGINCDGYGRLHRYNTPSERWVPERVPEQPAASRLGVSVRETRIAQLFQNAACDFRCWYCFVDRKSLAGRSANARFMTTEEMIELYLRDGAPSPVIVLTGGQPDIVPEWTLWMMQTLQAFGLSDRSYLWQDDNLSCGYTWTCLAPAQRDYIRSYYNYGRCCCLKSFTREGFAETTAAPPELFDRQFALLRKLVDWGVDVYVYLTMTVSSLTGLSRDMSTFVDRLRLEIHPNIPLRVVPLEIEQFTPTLGRITPVRRRALDNQYIVLKEWLDQLQARFSSQELEMPIHQVPLD